MSQSLKIALVGATGFVGEALREQMAASELQPAELFLLASADSAGQRLEYGSHYLGVKELASFDFGQVDVAIFATPATVTALHAPRAAQAGCRLIDLSGHLTTDMQLPLLFPGLVDATRAKAGGSLPGPIACVLAQLLAGAASDGQLAGVDVSAMLPAAIAGRAGVNELASQTTALLNGQEPENVVFPKRLAFQVQPAGPSACGSSHQALSQGTVLSLKRLFGLELAVACQAFFVPSFYGMTLAVTLTFHQDIDEGRVAQWFDEAGIVALEDDATQSVEQDAVVRGALQQDVTRSARQVRLWLTADSVQLMASSTAKIVESLLKND